MASSPFDLAWAPETAALQSVMGEAITLGEVEVPLAVVSEVEAGTAHKGPMVVNSGVLFQVWLTVAQVTELSPDGPLKLKGKIIVSRLGRGRVVKVWDLGGAGVQLDCGPVGDR